MLKYYVVATDINGTEYAMHGGYSYKWDGRPHGFQGYATRSIAKAVMTRLMKAEATWISDGEGREHDRCTYRIEEVTI